jgi:hypothetical protein
VIFYWFGASKLATLAFYLPLGPANIDLPVPNGAIRPNFRVLKNHRFLSKFHSNLIRGVYTTYI